MRPLMLTDTNGKKLLINANLLVEALPHRKGSAIKVTGLAHYTYDHVVQETPEQIFSKIGIG